MMVHDCSSGCSSGCGCSGCDSDGDRTDEVKVGSIGRVSIGLMGLPSSSVKFRLDSVEGGSEEVVWL